MRGRPFTHHWPPGRRQNLTSALAAAKQQEVAAALRGPRPKAIVAVGAEGLFRTVSQQPWAFDVRPKFAPGLKRLSGHILRHERHAARLGITVERMHKFWICIKPTPQTQGVVQRLRGVALLLGGRRRGRCLARFSTAVKLSALDLA